MASIGAMGVMVLGACGSDDGGGGGGGGGGGDNVAEDPTEDANCGGRPGRLTVQRWQPTPDGDAVAEIFTDDLSNVTLDDRSAVAIVFAPPGFVAPPPFGVYALDALTDAASSAQPGEGGSQRAGATRGPLSLPAVSTTVSVPPVEKPAAAALPTGTRDSFAVWVVASTSLATADGCGPDGVPGWDRDAEVCLQPAFLADRQIAFEYGGTVSSAGSLQVDAFDTPQVNLSGPFDEKSARRLADVLNG